MATKTDTSKKKAPFKGKANFLGAAGRNMTYRDLKRKAVILGMPFPDALSAGVFDLLHFISDSDNEPDLTLIDKYDDWVDEQLQSSGIPADDPLRSSKLRLGFLGEDENGGRKSKRVSGIKKQREKKPPRERDSFNLIKGTKKSYTFELASKGYELNRIIRRVLKRFPETSEKSIRLWYRKAKQDAHQN